MLPYKKVIGKSFKAFKDKRTYLTALITVIPTVVYLIVSAFLLSDFTKQLNEVINEFFILLENPDVVITSEIINSMLSTVIEVLIKNVKVIILDVSISFIAWLITTMLTYVVYYVAYKVINKEETNIKNLFTQLLGGLWLTIVYGVRILLWSLLFIVPGIIKAFSYSLCFFIKIENPNEKASLCIRKSVELMKGRRERLFIQYLLYLLISMLASIILSNVVIVVTIIPQGNVITSIISAYVTSLLNLFWAYNVCVYYNEVKEDEKYLNENPKLREQGVTGRIKNDKKYVKVEYGSYFLRQNPYQEDNEKINREGNNNNQNPYED